MLITTSLSRLFSTAPTGGTDPTMAPVAAAPVVSPVLPPVLPATALPTPFDQGDSPTQSTGGGASADPTPSTFAPSVG
jgi:hypothetical protein